MVAAALAVLAVVVVARATSGGPAGVYLQLSGDREAANDAMVAVDLAWRTPQGQQPRSGVAGQTLAYDADAEEFGIRVLLEKGISDRELSEIVDSASAHSGVVEVVLISEGEWWPDCSPEDGCRPVESPCTGLICRILN